MAYPKHTWTDGELITKENLNNLEAGVEAADTAATAAQSAAEEAMAAGMTGSASAVTDIDTPDSADAPTTAKKVNELLAALRTRGVIS